MGSRWRGAPRRPVSIAEHVSRLVRIWRRPIGSEICQPARERCAKELLAEFGFEDTQAEAAGRREREPGEEG